MSASNFQRPCITEAVKLFTEQLEALSIPEPELPPDVKAGRLGKLSWICSLLNMDKISDMVGLSAGFS